jgi:hypothetical protein
MTNCFARQIATGARLIFYRSIQAAAGLLLSTVLSHAATLYTFSHAGTNPYSFSLLEPGILTNPGAFGIAPFQVGGLTFTQATFSESGGTECFQFGTAGASLAASSLSCGVGASAPDGGWQSLFFGANTPGSYTAFNAISQGSAPAAPDRLTIQTVSAYQYTFSNSGPNPYSFFFLEPAILTASGRLAIAPFQVGGLTFPQATFSESSGTECFQFGTAGASLAASSLSCSLGAFAPDGGWQSLFFGANMPGGYTAFNGISEGSAAAAPTQLTITALPEPASPVLFSVGLAVVAALAWRRKRLA